MQLHNPKTFILGALLTVGLAMRVRKQNDVDHGDAWLGKDDQFENAEVTKAAVPTDDDEQHKLLDDSHNTQPPEKGAACGALLAAFAAGIPIPLPVASTIVQITGLLACCPDWVYEKVVALKDHLGQTEAQRWAREHANLTHDQIEESAADEERAADLELYGTLLAEHASRNKDTTPGKVWADVKRPFTPRGGKRFDRSKYGENMKAMKEMEERMPWLLYHQLAGAFADGRLSLAEKASFVEGMVQLKQKYPFLPAVDALGQPRDPELPSSLLLPDAINTIEEVSSEGGNATTMRERLWGALGRKKDSTCAALSRFCTKGVAQMKRWMEKPSDGQLEILKQQVLLLKAQQ